MKIYLSDGKAHPNKGKPKALVNKTHSFTSVPIKQKQINSH